MNKFFSYIRTPVFRKNLFYAIGSGVILLLSIFYCLRFYTYHGESTPVPDFKRMPLESAIALLESNGFNYKLDSVYRADVKPGTIVEQDPDEGTMVKNHRTIYLTVNTRNAPDIGFPDIIGKNILEVRAILRNFGLRLGDTTYTSDIERNRVVEARFGGVTIQKGQEISKGSKIDLVLGDGEGASDVDLPDLTGLDLSSAILLLRGGSLNLGMKQYEGVIRDSSKVKIIKQFPAVSDSVTKVPIGSRIDVTLSNQ